MSDNEAYQFILQSLGQIHTDIGNLYDKFNAFMEKQPLTRADCDECKKEVDAKRHGVSPKLAYIGVPILVAILYTIGQNIRYIWHAFVLLVRGG